MNKVLATAILALVLASAAGAEAPRSNLSISPAPLSPTSPPAVTKAKFSSTRVLKAEETLALAEANKLYPKNASERAAYLIKVGKPILALPELDKVIKADPQSVEAYVAKAKIYNDLHRFDESQVALRRALVLQPDYQPARILLATVAIQKGDLNGAMEQLGQSLGFALATKSGTAAPAKPAEVNNGGLLAPLVELPGAWILQSLHMILPKPVTIASSTTSNSDETFDSAAVVHEEASVPHPVAKLTALKPKEDQPLPPSTVPTQKSNLVFTRELDDRPEAPEPPRTAKKNTLKFISDEDESTLESAELPFDTVSAKVETAVDKTVLVGQQSFQKSLPAEKPLPADRQLSIDKTLPVNRQLANDNSLPADKQSSVEKPLAVAQALPVVAPVVPAPPVVSAPPAEVAESKPAPLQYDPGNLEKSSLGFVAAVHDLPASSLVSASPSKIELSPPDQWTEKLKYLSEHGTAELSDGEAFMFAEDTGEATLFLADGKKIRRVISVPRDNDVVVATRRPELLKAEDLVYRLALLAKLMPSAAPPAAPHAQSDSPTQIAAAVPKPASAFNADPLSRADGFVGWLKHLFPF